MVAVYERSVGIVSRSSATQVELVDGRVISLAPPCTLYDEGSMLELWTVEDRLVHARVLRHREYLALERVLSARAAFLATLKESDKMRINQEG